MLFIRAAHCHLWLIVRLAPKKQIRRMLTFFVDTAEAFHDPLDPDPPSTGGCILTAHGPITLPHAGQLLYVGNSHQGGGLIHIPTQADRATARIAAIPFVTDQLKTDQWGVTTPHGTPLSLEPRGHRLL